MRRASMTAALVLVVLEWYLARSAAEEPAAVDQPKVNSVESVVSDAKRPVITAVAIAPGGGLVATAGDDHLVRIWDRGSGRVLHTLKAHSDWVRTITFSPDGKQLASAGDDRQIVIWNVAAAKIATRIGAEPYAVYALAYNPEGSLLAAVGFGDQLHLYDAASGSLAHRIDGPGADLRTVAFSPDGRQLATAGRNGRIRAWAIPRYSVDFDVVAVRGRIRTLAYLPDGDKLASAGDGRTISIWNARDGREHYRFSCPAGKVLSMTVCGERFVATGGSDNVVRVWNWQTKTEIDRLTGHTGSVATLAYDPATTTLISGGYDTTVRVWKLDPSGSLPGEPGAARTSPRVR